jgi:Na+/H+ antiporter NhaC
MLGSSLVAEQLATSEEGLSSMKFVCYLVILTWLLVSVTREYKKMAAILHMENRSGGRWQLCLISFSSNQSCG